MEYNEIIKSKEKCYEIIKFLEDENLLKIFRYYKGDLLPLINSKCRKTMTCGDIDCFQYDYVKKIFRIIECKRVNETQKQSQNNFLNFATNIKIEGYKTEVYKIIGDPPFLTAVIINMKTKEQKTVSHEDLLKFLNLETE